MTAVIARKGKFTLRYKSWFGDITPSTWDLEICADCVQGTGVYVICSFRHDKGCEAPDVVSCGNRLIDAMSDIDDIEAVRELILIASRIIQYTDNVPLKIYT